MMGRPVNLGQHRIDEIDEFDDVDEVGIVNDRQEKSWYVQVGAGDVKVLSREQLQDFYRLGIINASTYIWQQGMQHWLPLSTFVGPEPDPAMDDNWQVLMGPGDVRTLTLEQLDDFFRLGVIDEQTFVWQSGMQQWSQLSTLIGPIEDEKPDDHWYALMAPGDVRSLSLEQLDDFFRLEVVSEHTLLWQPGMAQWLPLGTIAGIEPSAPVSTSSAVPSVTHGTHDYALSAPPLALSISAPEQKHAKRSWLLRTAIAAGLLLTLYRNDVFYSAAQAAKQQSQYARAERRVLGGPQFGTSRSVDKLMVDEGGRLAPVRLPWIVMQHEAAAAASPTIEPRPSEIDQPRKQPKLAASAGTADSVAPTNPIVANEPAALSHDVDSRQSSSGVAAAVTGQSSKHKFAAVKPVSIPHVTRKPSTRGQSVFRANGKGDYYDPLNPAM